MRYELVSGALFALIAIAQLMRAVLAVPVRVGSTSVPLWVSLLAFVITGSLSLWAFSTARRTA